VGDLSAKIAEMLHTGDGITGRCERSDFSQIVDLVLDRYPDATAKEIERGFRISMELIEQEDIEIP